MAGKASAIQEGRGGGGLARPGFLFAALLAGLSPASAASGQDPSSRGAVGTSPTVAELVQGYLWPSSDEERAAAEAALLADSSLARLDRERMRQLESAVRAGRRDFPVPSVDERLGLVRLLIDAPGPVDIPVLIELPDGYDPVRAWPLVFAMHGGPTGSVDGAFSGAGSMIGVWRAEAERAGWIVAAPAMVTTTARGGRSADRLPYQIFQPELVRAVIHAVAERYHVDADRIVATGISLGSNFSIAYAAAHPDWFSAIVPVSTEGESREGLLRNLVPVPTYVLEGALDQNIRGVSGPRALAEILEELGGEIVYREFADRAHEGFAEHYGEVLEWLEARPREAYPGETWRVPHAGIVPVSRRVHWIVSDTRQGLLHARVAAPNVIEVRARHARTVEVFLHDELVDLDLPVEIRVNGERAFRGSVARSAPFALEEIRARGTAAGVYPASVVVSIPDTPGSRQRAEALASEVAPTRAEGVLSFWEMYAVRALRERFPTLGLEGEEAALVEGAVATPPGWGGAPGQRAVRVTAVDPAGPFAGVGVRVGDLLVEVGGEPFFEGRSLPALHEWLLRELRGEPAAYTLRLMREGVPLELSATLALGPYSGGS